MPDQVRSRGYVYEPAWWDHVHVNGPYVKEYHTPNPTENRKVPKAMKSLWKVRSHSYVACVCIPNPNSGVTYWVFRKIIKPHATYIFQVKARCQCTVDGRAKDTMEVGDGIFLWVYFYLTVLSYSIEYCFLSIYFELSYWRFIFRDRFIFGFMNLYERLCCVFPRLFMMNFRVMNYVCMGDVTK